MSNKYLDLNGLKYYDNKLRTGATKVGKAALADTATKATNDSEGNNIAATYIKSEDLVPITESEIRAMFE